MSDNSDPDRRPLSGPPGVAELSMALGEGDPQRVRALIEAGADIRYKRDGGYDALLDAVHSRDLTRDTRLLDLLALLVAHGAYLSGVSTHEESGLRVLSRLGRFDAVRLLLDAGADKSQLEWTPLVEVVALGSLADVQAALAQGAALEERDWWSRTAWLIALLSGDIARAKLLREYGADLTACGRCGCPPLFYAIQGHHTEMVRWLLSEGADVHQTDEFGTTALIEAVENDDLECVEILLAAGADVEADVHGTALFRAGSRDVILRLLEAGADPAHLTCEGQRIILGLPAIGDDALAAVSPEDFRHAFTRSFGKANPERMRVTYWEAMIHCGASAYDARQRFKVEVGPGVEPIWCAQRFGQSLTLLPDGRAVQIGGEHEDFYDPDFSIYNDVFVHERDGSVTIYGYPETVFPPTDFHTATLIGEWIYVIGSLGYQGTRLHGKTPVYRLDLRTMRMERLDAHGEAPGWIYEQRAAVVNPHRIRVWGGKIVTRSWSGESHDRNAGSFVLDLDRLSWCRESTPGPRGERT
jgi:ankyrin repeat protein